MSSIPLNKQLEDLLKRDPFDLIERQNTKFNRLINGFGESYVLFGAGRLGLTALEGLHKAGIKPLAFTDNNPSLWGKSIKDVQVIPPQEALRIYAKKAIFVITIYTSAPIWEQLNSYDIKICSFAELAWKYPKALLPHDNLELPQNIFNQASEVKAAYQLWADDTSRKEYLGQVKWHTSLDRSVLPPHLRQSDIYFPEDIFTPISGEVFVDCGAYDGDSIREFIKRQNSSFSQIIAIEPDPINCQSLNDQNAKLDKDTRNKILVMQYALGSQKEIVKFNATGTVGSSIGIGSYDLECATLDDLLINHIPTFIKMDIEGAEIEAIQGATNLIGKNFPIMAICMYHKQEHLWKIPLLLGSLSDQYQFFFRRYSDECWELVCYAVPKNRLKS